MTLSLSRRVFFICALISFLECATCWAANPGPRRVASCSSFKREYTFRYNAQGGLNYTVGTVLGPQCVQVTLDSVRFDAVISTAETSTAGKDLSSFLINGAPAIGGGGKAPAPSPLATFATNYSDFQTQLGNVNEASADLKIFIADIDNTLARTGDAQKTLDSATAYYTGTLRAALGKLQNASRKLYATDLPPGSICPVGSSLGAPLPGSPEFDLVAFKKEQAATVALDQAALDAAKAKQKADTTDAQRIADQPAIDAAQTALDAANSDLDKVNGFLAFADQYKCNTGGFIALTKQLQALTFWINRLALIGFTTPASGGSPSLVPVPGTPAPGLTKDFFLQAYQISCQNLLNTVTTDSVSISSVDQLPTVDGNPATSIPSSGTPPVFITVNCASPIAVSAGLEVSGIPNQEYAIVQSKDPAGGSTSIPKFSYTQNSPYHLLPIGIAHFRILESNDLRFSLHGSVGISGNLQGTGSGGSTAEYLFGGSFGFLRILYLTAGAHLGYKSVLAGGYNVGDTVPTAISTPTVYKAATVRYGIAITFSKP